MKTLGSEHLVKAFKGRKVVSDVSIHVRQGEVVGLLGPNGAGKTTTFYMMVGLIKPDTGSVHIDHNTASERRQGDRRTRGQAEPIAVERVDLSALPMHERAKLGVGYLAQEASAFRKLTVKENILAILEMTGLSREEQEKRTENLLSEFNLHHVSEQKAYTLSGGERRRTEVARALATQPDFILLDEPFVGIDPIAVSDLQAVIRQLKARGLGVLITDHNVRETLSIIDRAYLLVQGQVLISGTAKALASDPKAKKLYLGDSFKM